MKKLLILALCSFFLVPTAFAGTSSLRMGLKNNPEVKLVQQKLMDLGLYSGNIDGSFGPKTFVAVKNFQTQNGLKVDGIVGNQVRSKLSIINNENILSNPADVVKKIYLLNHHYNEYSPVQISQCTSGNQIYYNVRYEATGDAGTGTYSSNGTRLGVCGAFVPSGTPTDQICSLKMDSCMKVFQMKGSLGPDFPGIDVYQIQ